MAVPERKRESHSVRGSLQHLTRVIFSPQRCPLSPTSLQEQLQACRRSSRSTPSVSVACAEGDRPCSSVCSRCRRCPLPPRARTPFTTVVGPLQVKTRMQLETGKSTNGLVGTFKNIVREEGCVPQIRVTRQCFANLDRFSRVESGGCTGVPCCHLNNHARGAN